MNSSSFGKMLILSATGVDSLFPGRLRSRSFPSFASGPVPRVLHIRLLHCLPASRRPLLPLTKLFCPKETGPPADSYPIPKALAESSTTELPDEEIARTAEIPD
ncbi:hypothetical protein TIFTF001_049358 [Ficus carica]|uniref:Uncharacterized protein n=1 Tax=Ficus carica TaxID=3494 RepID=A0AA87YZW1_FICCA|nr:hypothetical protein TIFTF001_049358 [Ficus carica]